MENTSTHELGNKWLSVPIIATITRLLCRELTLQNDYLLRENKILKSKVEKRITFTDEERRTLVDAAMAMGRDLMAQVVTIVQPKTILAWQRRFETQKWDYSDRRKHNPGRPRISTDIEQLVCQMARENDWGYERIQGELKKLEIMISKSSVANILRRNGLPPSPERKGLSWREFLARHAPVFLCADTFQKEVWTFRGLVTAYVFFVIHLQTRKVLWARATFSPTNQWFKQQIRHVLWACEDQSIKPRFFLRDNDMLYPEGMDAILKSSGVNTVKTPFQAPNANSHAERYVLSCKRECLNHLLIFGLNRLQHVVDCYTSYFNEHRPHQGIDNRIPVEYYVMHERQGGSLPSKIAVGNVARRDFLGGLLKSYRRAA
ncbi:MAG: helix-turn-helix domain-containing protein [Planctomycetota bacterium]|jgi:putative transposase